MCTPCIRAVQLASHLKIKLKGEIPLTLRLRMVAL